LRIEALPTIATRRMLRRTTLSTSLAVSVALPALSLSAQEERPPFLTGMCSASESSVASDSIVDRPERPPSLAPGSEIPRFPDVLRRPGYDGTVVAVFVVDASGTVRPDAVAVMSSSDPILSAWACSVVPAMRFVPAWHDGRAVATEVRMPFRYHVVADSNPVYSEDQVERRISMGPVRGPALRYPLRLKQRGIEGAVLAEFVVDTTGRAEMDTFKVLRSSDEQFTQAVRATVAELIFTPAELKGRKVRQLVQQPFTFTIAR
jgi:TonB family protein